MSFDALTCSQCGAPLSVPLAVNFVTCNHCGVQLVVRREESASYTEKLADIDRRTEQLAEQVAQLAYREKIQNLERAWEAECARYMVNHKDGTSSVPCRDKSISDGIAIGAVGLFLALFVFGGAGVHPLLLVPLLFVGCGFAVAVSGCKRADDYQVAYQRYRRAVEQVTPKEVVQANEARSQRAFRPLLAQAAVETNGSQQGDA